MKRTYAEIAEGQMHYRHAGEGHEHVILLHMSGSSSDEYERVGDILAGKGFNVYAIDLLGFGASDPPPHYYSLAEHARTIAEFLEVVGIDSAYLYGNLATANLAVHVAVNHRDCVKGMMLAHPLYHPDPVHYTQKRNRPEFALIEPRADGGHLLEMWSRAAKYDASTRIADERFRCLHGAGEWSESLHWALFEDRPIGELLPDITVPTVMVAYSTFGEPALLREATALIPRGKFDVYEDTPYIARTSPERVVGMFTRYF